MDCTIPALRKLLEALKGSGYLINQRVEDAMLRVDRAIYCPSPQPYTDEPYQIGFGATISAPHMHAKALEVLKDKLVDGAKVLDVGCGSGYLTACMAHMIGTEGVVYGLDHVKELVSQSEKNIRQDCPELISSGRVKLLVADGRLGLPEFSPYDVIHVGATTTSEVASKLIDQLKPGGRMVLPIQRGEKQMFESVDKPLTGGEVEFKQLLQVRYVPLTDFKFQVQGWG